MHKEGGNWEAKRGGKRGESLEKQKTRKKEVGKISESTWKCTKLDRFQRFSQIFLAFCKIFRCLLEFLEFFEVFFKYKHAVFRGFEFDFARIACFWGEFVNTNFEGLNSTCLILIQTSLWFLKSCEDCKSISQEGKNNVT